MQSELEQPGLDNIAVVSHRWETKGQPDEEGYQLEAIRKYLEKNSKIRYLWYDYSCLPQGERTPEGKFIRKRTPAENVAFFHQLANANMLYLGCRVLILM